LIEVNSSRSARKRVADEEKRLEALGFSRQAQQRREEGDKTKQEEEDNKTPKARTNAAPGPGGKGGGTPKGNPVFSVLGYGDE
jgi:hypothetical protein